LLPFGGNPSPWLAASLDLNASGKPAFSYSTADQLRQTIISGLDIDQADGSLFIPSSQKIFYDVIAHGVDDTNSTFNPVGQILANGTLIIKPFTENGVLVAPLTADGSGIEEQYRFLNFSTPTVSQTANTALALSFRFAH
jgi:hypothetical protein